MLINVIHGANYIPFILTLSSTVRKYVYISARFTYMRKLSGTSLSRNLSPRQYNPNQEDWRFKVIAMIPKLTSQIPTFKIRAETQIAARRLFKFSLKKPIRRRIYGREVTRFAAACTHIRIRRVYAKVMRICTKKRPETR